ncbi:MAG: NAD(+)/NADH kinase, partial [Clostridiales bacterium]|nr:NAD(+)/NADH kinase [Clostridiales bacterium]
MKIIGILQNGSGGSEWLAALLGEKLRTAGFEPLPDAVDGAELVVCIGGDGSFLHALRRFDFPDIPFAGFNTGHLGFFQELDEGDIDFFLTKYKSGGYVRQIYRTVEAVIEHDAGSLRVRGLNEIVVRGADARLCHLEIYIGDSFIENFSGDGVVVSTPAGSTAYNYALGGSIVDPRLSLLQLSP